MLRYKMVEAFQDKDITIHIDPSFIVYSIGTFIKYYKISQLIHTQIIAN